LKGIEGLSTTAFAGSPVEKAFRGHTSDATAFDTNIEKMKCSSCAVAATWMRQHRECCRTLRPRAW
jgi:hypothetical protein